MDKVYYIEESDGHRPVDDAFFTSEEDAEAYIDAFIEREYVKTQERLSHEFAYAQEQYEKRLAIKAVFEERGIPLEYPYIDPKPPQHRKAHRLPRADFWVSELTLAKS